MTTKPPSDDQVDMPQAFADAVCNVHHKTINYAGMHDEALRVELLDRHSRGRYRGMEGTNGVACDDCKMRAEKIWTDYVHILASLRRAM